MNVIVTVGSDNGVSEELVFDVPEPIAYIGAEIEDDNPEARSRTGRTTIMRKTFSDNRVPFQSLRLTLRVVDVMTDQVVAEYGLDTSHGPQSLGMVLPATANAQNVREYRLEVSEIPTTYDAPTAVHVGLPRDWDNLPPAKVMSGWMNDDLEDPTNGYGATGGSEGRL